MILVDTSVWVSHLSRGLEPLAEVLERNDVLIHPFILGELSLGSLKNRAETLDLLYNLPKVKKAEDEEVMALIEENRLYSQGIGWVDVHLLASARLSECSLWTFDRSLMKVGKLLEIAVET